LHEVVQSDQLGDFCPTAKSYSPGFREGSHGGSDVHVRLSLCRRPRQVVVTDEELDGTDMVGEFGCLGTMEQKTGVRC
jgi:hypothetical protein